MKNNCNTVTSKRSMCSVSTTQAGPDAPVLHRAATDEMLLGGSIVTDNSKKTYPILILGAMSNQTLSGNDVVENHDNPAEAKLSEVVVLPFQLRQLPQTRSFNKLAKIVWSFSSIYACNQYDEENCRYLKTHEPLSTLAAWAGVSVNTLCGYIDTLSTTECMLKRHGRYFPDENVREANTYYFNTPNQCRGELMQLQDCGQCSDSWTPFVAMYKEAWEALSHSNDIYSSIDCTAKGLLLLASLYREEGSDRIQGGLQELVGRMMLREHQRNQMIEKLQFFIDDGRYIRQEGDDLIFPVEIWPTSVEGEPAR